MSLRSAVVSYHAVQCVRRTSLFPFLYNTPTLISPPKSERDPRSSHKYHKGHQSFSTTSWQRAEDDGTPSPAINVFRDPIFANPRSTPSADSSLPFENERHEPDFQTSKKSTLTSSEKAVFDRIFKDIKEEEEGQNEDEEDVEADPYVDINTIFDDAISQLQQREKEKQQVLKEFENRPKSFQRALERVVVNNLPLDDAKEFIRPIQSFESRETEKALGYASANHRRLVDSMLDQADSDVTIWEILEAQVFNLVRQLDAQVTMDEKARKIQERREKKAARERNKTTDDSPSDNIRDAVQDASTPESVALPKSTLFAILRTNYADYILSAIRLLRRHHPTSFYALHLLPTIKRLGPISYALGTSTNIYNEVMFLRWTQFSDLHGMADLVEEMINQGIEMNEVTKVFIRRLRARRRYAFQGKYGAIAPKWWDMRGNVEGWRRLWGMYIDVKKEETRKMAREARMKEEEEVREDAERVIRIQP